MRKAWQGKKSDSLRLDLDLSESSINAIGEGPSEIMFSPGGNEAYVFTQASPEHPNPEGLPYDPSKHVTTQPQHKEKHINTKEEDLDFTKRQLPLMPTKQTYRQRGIGTPREIFDEIFIERPKDHLTTYPRGERPTTVGQSDDSPNKAIQLRNKGRNVQKNMTSMPNRSPRPSPGKKGRDHREQQREHIQGRLEDIKTSLLATQVSTTDDTDNVYSTEHSAEPSPRPLPVLPYPYSLTREQFLHQNPDNLTAYRDIAAPTSERDEDDVAGIIYLSTGIHVYQN